MKTKKLSFRILVLMTIAAFCISCKPYYHYGAANDRTGTNGATNGTGEIATP